MATLAGHQCPISAAGIEPQTDLHLSLNQFSIDLLRRQLGKHAQYVFTYAGKPIASANTKYWRLAFKRAGIQNFRRHDLRHTWASWLIQHGTPMYDLQEMGGGKSVEMVRRYAHLAPAQMAKHAAVVGNNLLYGTNSAQVPICEAQNKGASLS